MESGLVNKCNYNDAINQKDIEPYNREGYNLLEEANKASKNLFIKKSEMGSIKNSCFDIISIDSSSVPNNSVNKESAKKDSFVLIEPRLIRSNNTSQAAPLILPKRFSAERNLHKREYYNDSKDLTGSNGMTVDE